MCSLTIAFEGKLWKIEKDNADFRILDAFGNRNVYIVTFENSEIEFTKSNGPCNFDCWLFVM